MTELPKRKSIRLPTYDYARDGYYYITICSQNRELCFDNAAVRQMIDNQWQELTNKFHCVDLDEYVIMPNHLHGIIIIRRGDPCGRPPDLKTGGHKARPYETTLGNIVGAFKSITTHKYIQGVKTKNWPRFNKRLWQRNYYERVIRNDDELNKIRQYIIDNPQNWEFDRNNPEKLNKK